MGRPSLGMTLRQTRRTMTARCVRWRSSSTSLDTFGKFSLVSRTQTVRKPEGTLCANFTCVFFYRFHRLPHMVLRKLRIFVPHSSPFSHFIGFLSGLAYPGGLLSEMFWLQVANIFFYCFSVIKERCLGQKCIVPSPPVA